MKNEYKDFLKSKELQVPHHISSKILNRISEDVKPLNLPILLMKVFALQFSVGLVTLSVCPQFGIGPIGGGHGITHYFMQIGNWACALFCASFYFGLSYFFTFLFLSSGEAFLIYRQRGYLVFNVLISSMVLISMGYYMSGVDEMFFAAEFISIWILGGLVLSQFILEGARFLKNLTPQYLK